MEPQDRARGGRSHAHVRDTHVRELLDTEAPDACLVLREGRVLVVPDGAADARSGALTVISRRDLLDRLGNRAPDETWLRQQAALLDTEIAKIGA